MLSLLKEAATKTNDIAGDGTTTSTILAHAIVNEGLKALEAGYNPMLLKRGIEQATDAVVDALRKMAVKIDTKEEIASVATNSAADAEIGDLIARCYGQSRQRRCHHCRRIQIHAIRERLCRRYAV